MVIGFVLSGCANLYSIFRNVDLDRQSVIIDIKQRAIISSEDPYSGKRRICAEPSPDSLSAYEGKGSASVNGPDKMINVNGNVELNEKATTVGERSQTIQLLRDSAYRICEAYINGAIDEFEYQQFLRKYQKNAVSLLAIEQLSKSMLIAKSGTTAESKTLSDAKIFTDAIQRLVGLSTVDESIETSCWGYLSRISSSKVDEGTELKEPCLSYLKAFMEDDMEDIRKY